MADSSPLINPFVGLRAFEENEDYLFFGRSAEINDLIKKFGTRPFLAVIGSSGSGKSSLVKSGLLPAIYGGYLAPGKNWRVAVLRPGDNPIGNLAKELTQEGVLYKNINKAEINYRSFTETTLRRSSNGLVQAYRQAHLPDTENLLVVVDQFEELFRFNNESRKADSESDAINFVKLLLEATDEKQTEHHIYVLITMRSDFLGDCARFSGLPEAINAGQYLVPRMTRDEIREAITGPIAIANAQIAPRLVTRVLNDVGNNLDQLPILQHALMRTWDAWQKKNKRTFPIDIDDYEKIGGMSKALNLHAEEAYAELTNKKQQLICELMFKALTDKAADVRGIRIPRKVKVLSTLTNASSEEVIKVVEVFRKTGRTFLMPPVSESLTEASDIDISHESLMRVWQRLVNWTDEEAESSEVYLRLSAEAQLYNQVPPKTGLWRNPELAIGLRWYRNNNPTATWAERYDKNFDQSIAFLLDSEKEALRLNREKARRAKVFAWTAVGLIILFAALSLISWRYKVKADNEAKRAEDSSTVAKAQRLIAIDSANAAIEQRRIAEDSTSAAKEQRRIADDSTKAAKEQRKRAIAATAIAIEERNKADAATKKAIDLLLQNSVAEYQRLIREGPTDEDSITNAAYDYKYDAYCYHLDSLKKMGVDKAVKKNDELYDKLYFSLKFRNDGEDKWFVINDAVINNRTASEYEAQNFSLGTGDSVTYSDKKIHIQNSGNADIVPYKYKVSAAAKNDADHRIFIATEDNVLSVFEYHSTVPISRIPMGGNVTAMDYDAANDVIFFGLMTGEIGYIKFDRDKKNQPVYRNDLDFKITAMEYFMKGTDRYLLAASSKGRAVLYEMGNTSIPITEFLRENKQLTGIELPENIGEIRSAKYLPGDDDRIELKTSGRKYLWNPFVDELLAKLNAGLDNTILDSTIHQTLRY